MSGKQVIFNDGEGLDFNDLNNSQLYMRDSILRTLFEMALHSPGYESVNPIGYVGMYNVGAGSRLINSQGGILVGNLAASGDDEFVIALTEAADWTFTLDAPTAGRYRRDIVQVKLDDVDTSEARDFKDATTGLLTSPSTPKLRTTTATISVKKGTDQVSTALADSNEPTPDTGYTKFVSFRVDDGAAGIDDTIVRDYRYPLGSISSLVAGTSAQHTDSYWATATDDWGMLTCDAAARSLMCDVGLPRHCRVSTITTYQEFASAPAAGDLILARSPIFVNSTTTTLNSLGTLVTTGSILGVNAMNGLTLPLWSNGYPNPNIASTNDSRLVIKMISGTTFDRFCGIKATGYGRLGLGSSIL